MFALSKVKTKILLSIIGLNSAMSLLLRYSLWVSVYYVFNCLRIKSIPVTGLEIRILVSPNQIV